ncbi:MAG: metallophosphoesterase [Clostridia bacterium]|nr:metallophosphoesterase [Clostridia bacterium]
MRTDKEIASDVEKPGTDDLILHYDMFGLESSQPLTLKDLSKEKNIEMVLGLGDITDTEVGDNTVPEWELVLDAFKIIDDYVPHIPIRGNHDSMTYYNKYMSQLNYKNLIDGQFVETNILNTYVDFEVGGIPYLFLVLDYALTDEQLDWACSVVEKFPNHNVIVLRHTYMNHDYRPLQENGEMDPTVLKRGYLSGQKTWDKLISQYENIVMSLSGHIGSDLVVTRQVEGVHGNTVTEMLIDYQASDNAAVTTGRSDGGLGVVNMFYFSEDGKKLTVESYSTILDKYYYDINQFTVELDTVTDVKYQKPKKAPVPPRGEANATEIKMTIDSLTATVNGESKTLDAAPIIKSSRTMLPVRFVAENLGATVGWDDATKTVSVKSADTTIEIVIGASTAKVNGKEIALDSPAFIENSRTYLPVRVVAENLGATVGWDDATKTATLTK